MEAAAEVVLTKRNRRLEWKFTENLPPVWADEIHLEEIIRNLMRNAEKYSPPDFDHYLVRLTGWGLVRISVKDHGPGHPAEYQQHIFERFGRGRAHHGESAPPGWGLGLYFARKLIQAQRGSINVNSPIWQDDKAPGAEFYLLVPVATFSEE